MAFYTVFRQLISYKDEVLLFRNTLRAEGDLFLDDMSLEEFRSRLPIPVRVVSTNGEQFYRALYGLEEA